MKAQLHNNPDSPSTDSFNGEAGTKGYDLNRMCYSFNSEDNCKKFKDFPEAYCHNFKLDKEEIHAVTDLDVLRMINAGGNIDYLAKLTDIYGLKIRDLGAQQNGMTSGEFSEMLETLSK